MTALSQPETKPSETFDLRALRKGRNMTQGELADALNQVGGSFWNQTVVSEIESKTRGIGIELASTLGAYFDLDPLYVMGRRKWPS